MREWIQKYTHPGQRYDSINLHRLVASEHDEEMLSDIMIWDRALCWDLSEQIISQQTENGLRSLELVDWAGPDGRELGQGVVALCNTFQIPTPTLLLPRFS